MNKKQDRKENRRREDFMMVRGPDKGLIWRVKQSSGWPKQPLDGHDIIQT